MSAIELDGVGFRYPGAGTEALADVSVHFRAGEVTWLYGAVGAGCTTMLLVAAGLAPRHTGGELAGSVRLLGADPAAPTSREALLGRAAYVTATPVLQLSGVAGTVWEEVAFAPANLGWTRERIGIAADAALDRLGVGHLRERDPASLSGGEMQRVVLAGMLALTPDVWLLDEPGAALDHAGRRTLAGLLAAEAARGAAVVIASEDADETLAVADRVVVLDGGRVALEGAPASVLAGEEIWTRGPGSTSVAELARRAAGARREPVDALAAPYPLDAAEALRRWT